MPDEPVTLAQVKAHLRLDHSAEDAHLALLITAARRSVENATGRIVTAELPDVAGSDREVVAQAMLLLIGSWYMNRESVAISGVTEMPLAVRYLLDPLRAWVV